MGDTAVQLTFLDPLEPRILPRGGWPFWTLNIKSTDAPIRQYPHRLSDMDWVLGHINRDLDTYMSQGFFDRPCRRAMHAVWITHAYVDLDLYHLPPWREWQDAAWIRRHAAAAINLFCDDEGIFPPSLIIFSGRGIYLKWMWSSPIPRAAAGRAVAVNSALVRRFAEWGADPKCVDVSRILRVIGTTNTKSGERTEILWQHEDGGQVRTYDFDLFADEMLLDSLVRVRRFREESTDRTKAQIHLLSSELAKHGQKVTGQRACWEDWHWGVVEDIRWIVNHRWGGTVPVGYRALVGHLAACQLAKVIPASQLWQEILALNRIILPADYVNTPEFRAHCSTLLAKAKQAATGQKVEYEGKIQSPLY